MGERELESGSIRPPYPSGGGNWHHGFYGLMLPPVLPSFSSPQFPPPVPWAWPKNHNKALGLLCAAHLLSDHTCSIWCPCPVTISGPAWTSVLSWLYHGTLRKCRSQCLALCSMLTRAAQLFLLDDTALRLMYSHAHILCSQKKCERPRSRSGPHWKRKYECTNRGLKKGRGRRPSTM